MARPARHHHTTHLLTFGSPRRSSLDPRSRISAPLRKRRENAVRSRSIQGLLASLEVWQHQARRAIADAYRQGPPVELLRQDPAVLLRGDQCVDPRGQRRVVNFEIELEIQTKTT